MGGKREVKKIRNYSLLLTNREECCPVGDFVNYTEQNRTHVEHVWIMGEMNL